MKRLFISVAILFSVAAFSQVTQIEGDYDSFELYCQQVVPRGATVNIDTLIVDCVKTLLVQDNAIVNIGYVQGEGLRILYGDSSYREVEMDSLIQIDLDDNIYYDYRPKTDANPIVSFECRPSDLFYSGYVDIEGVECETTLRLDEPVVIQPDWNIKLYSWIGILVYEGPYSGLFNGQCGLECLKDEYYNKLWITQFRNEDNKLINKKWIQVR